jgi:NADH-quinone oxidoreductase subunit C
MAEKKSSLDAVALGPSVSADTAETPQPPPVTAPDHPSVAGLGAKFPDAILRHDIVAGNHRDVTAVDYGAGTPLQVVYQLFSLTHRRALSLKCELPLDALEIESVDSLWKAANWLEREVYDLFGITFLNHPDLRRILMPLDYAEGHPLRKDFPLRGRFTRAEQTRRALSQDLEHYYTEQELDLGGDSQALPPAGKETPEETGLEVVE